MQGDITKIKALAKSGTKGQMSVSGFIDYMTDEKYYDAEYYIDKEQENGVNSTMWSGRGAEALGLSGSVDKADLERVTMGFDRHVNVLGANRTGREVLAFDVTNSPPKSVSIAAAFAPHRVQKIILNAMWKANAESMKVYEDNLTVRTGHNGQSTEKIKGLTIASVMHACSRSLDMQFHQHNAINALALKDDGSFAALDHNELLKLRKFSGAVYQASLAKQLTEAGMTLEKDSKNEWTFRLKDISKQAEEEFSNGRKNIAAHLKERGIDIDSASKKLISKVAKTIREKKDEPTFKDLIEVWKIRGRQFNLNEAKIESMLSKEKTESKAFEADAIKSLREATSNTTQYTENQLRYIVATHAATTGGASLDEINRTVDAIQNSSQVFSVGHSMTRGNFGTVSTEAIFTSRERVQEDFEMLKIYKDSQHDHSFKRSDSLLNEALKTYQDQKSEEAGKQVTLTAEQLEVLKHCTQEGRIAFVEGFAGTGKSFTLGAVAEAERLAGQRVLGTSLQKTVATDLVAGAGLKSEDVYTTAQLLIDVENGKLVPDSSTTLIVDEAAMISNHEAHRIFKAFENSKIVFVGDREQYEAINQGGYFAGLINEGAKFAQLKDITRQKESWARDAVLDFKNGESLKALNEYDARGNLHIEASEDAAIKKAADAYLNDSNDLLNKEMTASTHDAVNKMNNHAREALTKSGHLGADEFKIVVNDRNGNEVELPVRLNERVRFTKNEKKNFSAANGQKGTVIGVEKSGSGFELTIKKDTGETVTVNTNSYKNLWHGYARTGHISQGKTDNVNFNYLDRRYQSRNAAYVMNSRARFGNHIFTSRRENETREDAKKMLAGSMQRVDAKKWAVAFFNDQQRKELVEKGVISLSQYDELSVRDGKKAILKSTLKKFSASKIASKIKGLFSKAKTNKAQKNEAKIKIPVLSIGGRGR